MPKTAKWQILLLALVLSALFGKEAQAQTINATNCSSTAVQTALNSVAADGTTVVIPSGSCSWTTSVAYNQVYSTTIQGQSTVTGTCAPGGSCAASDSTNITLTGSGSGSITIHTKAGKSLRITGLSLTNPSGGSAAYGAITIDGTSTAVRVDHNHVNDLVTGDHTFQVDAINGVFDHNLLDSTNQANTFIFQPTNNGGNNNANDIWTQPDALGSGNFVFVENNLIQNVAFAFDCDFGGRITFRYNIIGTNTRLQSHGVGSGAQRRGCRTMEVYQNTFTFSSSPNSNSFAFVQDFESGTGMWWGNTITAFTTFLREDVVRSNSSTYTQTASPNGWGYCGTAASGSGTAWDGSTSGNGYPCLDSIGRGQSDQLTDTDFPNIVNQTTGTIAWPHQLLVPVYVWGNTLNTNSYAQNHLWQNFDNAAKENQDYYLQLPNVDEPGSFTGAAGVGCGPSTGTGCPANGVARPATCTTGVGYWNVTSQSFFVCTATNTWGTTAYYTPYTYPHPLTQGSTLVAPPTSLAAVVQ